MNNKIYRRVSAFPPEYDEKTGKVRLPFFFLEHGDAGEKISIEIDYGKEMKFDYQEEDVFKLISNTIAGFFRFFSDEIHYSTFHFDCTRRFWKDLTYNNDVSFKFLQECGAISASDFPEAIEVEYAEYPAWGEYGTFTNNSRIAVAFSGGNESTLTMDILDKLGYQATPVSIVKPGDFDACKVPRFKGRTKGIATNLTSIFSKLHPTMMKYEDIYLYTYVPLLLLMESVFLNQEGFEYLLVGDEFDCSFRMYTRDGLPVHSKNCYDQSNIFKRRLTQYLHDIGYNIQVLSILEPLYTTGILVLVDKFCPDKEKKYVFSCFYPVKKWGKTKPCNKCLKCKRIAGLLHSLELDESKWGYKFNPEWRASPEDLFNSFGCQEEYESMNYRLQVMGYEGFGEPDSNEYESPLQINIHPVWANIWSELPLPIKKVLSGTLADYRKNHV